jgi:hypothetical protein
MKTVLTHTAMLPQTVLLLVSAYLNRSVFHLLSMYAQSTDVTSYRWKQEIFPFELLARTDEAVEFNAELSLLAETLCDRLVDSNAQIHADELALHLEPRLPAIADFTLY